MAAEHKFQKIAIGSIMHESNSFNAEPTILSDFHLREAEDARAVLNDWAVGNSEVAGFVEEGRRRGFDLIPTIYAGATPKDRLPPTHSKS